MPEVVWKQGAENDLLQIFSEFERTGARFRRALRHSTRFHSPELGLHPEMAPVFEPPVRRLVIGASGFGLFYSVEARGIMIHALLHLSRSPERIRDRIRRLLRFD